MASFASNMNWAARSLCTRPRTDTITTLSCVRLVTFISIIPDVLGPLYYREALIHTFPGGYQQFSLWLSVSVVRYGVVVRAVRVESHLGRFYPPDREV